MTLQFDSAEGVGRAGPEGETRGEMGGIIWIADLIASVASCQEPSHLI